MRSLGPRPRRSPSSLPPLLFLSAALLGCNGNVFQDVASGTGGPHPGTGGAPTGNGGAPTGTGASTSGPGGAPTTSGPGGAPTTTTWTTSSTADCQALASAYEATLAQVAECNACGNQDGCVPGVVYTDTCGCEVVINSANPGGPDAAKMAYWNWKGAGCAPSACPCPPLPGTSWSCKPTSAGSCAGRCAP